MTNYLLNKISPDSKGQSENLEPTVEDLKNLESEINALKDEYRRKSKQLISDIFKSFFEKFPEVYCVCWTQYSPYFNDGEPCRFGVNESSVVFLDQLEDDFESLDDIYPGDDGYNKWNLNTSYEPSKPEPRYLPALSYFYNTCEPIIFAIEDQIFEDLFGDHASVYATIEGFEVSEYDHD